MFTEKENLRPIHLKGSSHPLAYPSKPIGLKLKPQPFNLNSSLQVKKQVFRKTQKPINLKDSYLFCKENFIKKLMHRVQKKEL